MQRMEQQQAFYSKNNSLCWWLRQLSIKNGHKLPISLDKENEEEDLLFL